MKHIVLASISVVIPFSHANIPNEMTLYRNDAIDPCHDFYEYACGNWLTSNPLQATDLKLESAFKMMDDKNELVFKKIKKQSLVGRLWDSCLSHAEIKEFPFRDDIRRIASAMTHHELFELVGQFFRTGTQAFTALTVEPDSKDSRINTVYLSPSTLPGMDSIYQTFETVSDQYRTYINALFDAAGVDVRNVGPDRTGADTVIDIEVELAMIKKRSHGPTRRMTIRDATDKWPNLVGEFLKGVGLLEKASVNKEFMIYVEKSDYFDAMERFIKSTPIKELRVYMIFAMMHSRIEWLGEKYTEIWYPLFGKHVNGMRQQPNRKAFCTSRLLQYMPDLFGKYYTEKMFDKKRKIQALEMTTLMKEAMEVHISQSGWMEEKDKIEAQAKLDDMLVLVGESKGSPSYPSHISRKQYPTNVRSILLHSFDNTLKKVGQPVKREEWTESPAIANAFYSLRENRLVLPTAILQPPLFNAKSSHPARNFGAIGSIIGHEMTHAFDIKGHMFDRRGNVRDWWSEGTVQAFKNQADRMKSLYSSFNVHGEHGLIGNVNGDLTLVENIADHGGLALAWTAYRKYITSVKQEASVKGHKDEDRMFFLAFAQTWCTNTRDETMRKLLHTDDRTPAKWRVNGAVMNNADFAKTFECKPDTPMNPSTKIRIWW